MIGIRTRITAVSAAFGAAALFVTLGVSMSSADEPKAPAPPAAPRLDPPREGAFNADLRKAQEQMFRAMQALTKDPNDAEARKQMDEAFEALAKALGGGIDRLPGANLPNADTVRVPDRVRLGVRLEPLTPLVADQLGLEPGKGVALADVVGGSAAEKAGFKVHDVVVEFAGKPVGGAADFAKQVGAVKAGAKVDAVVVRKGKRVEVKGIDLPAPQNDALPTNPRVTENGRGNNSASVKVSGDAFTIEAVQAGANYLITGKTGANGPTVEKVSIKSGDEVVEADSVAKVPEKYRPTVEKLLKNVGKPRGKVRD